MLIKVSELYLLQILLEFEHAYKKLKETEEGDSDQINDDLDKEITKLEKIM